MSTQSIKNKIKSNGVVYTPKWIVDLIIEKIDFTENFATHNILDPSCGDGAFLYEIAEIIILEAKKTKFSKSSNLRNFSKKHLWI